MPTSERNAADAQQHRFSWPAVGALALAATAAMPGSPVAQSDGGRQLLVGATIVDGTGTSAYRGEILIDGDRIMAVGAAGSLRASDAGRAATVIDLAGLALAPGFIDIHNHSTNRLQDDPLATTQIAPGRDDDLRGCRRLVAVADR